MITVELGTHVMLVALLVKAGVLLECAKAEGVAEGTQLPHRNRSPFLFHHIATFSCLPLFLNTGLRGLGSILGDGNIGDRTQFKSIGVVISQSAEKIVSISTSACR